MKFSENNKKIYLEIEDYFGFENSENIYKDIDEIIDLIENRSIIHQVVVNMSSLVWIGILQANILFGCIRSLSQYARVRIEVGNSGNGSSALWMLTKMGFFDALDVSPDIEIVGNITNGKDTGFCAFKVFEKIENLHYYIEALGNETSIDKIIGNGALEVDIIREGDFRDTILFELGENCFNHGGGLDIRYSISDAAGKERSDYKFLNNFGNRGYIEIAISDSGPGLIETISNSLVKEYFPEETYKIDKKIDRKTKKIPYSFEFSSTGDVEKRKERLKQLVVDGNLELFSKIVPTGLFYVNKVLKMYGGQLIIRTDNRLFSIDYDKCDSGEVHFVKQKLQKLDGTHFLLRIPKKKIVDELPLGGFDFNPLGKTISSSSYVNVATALRNYSDPSSAIHELERLFTNAIEKSRSHGNKLISFLFNGSHLETKVFSVFLATLSVMDKRGLGIVFYGLRKEYVETSYQQWEVASKFDVSQGGIGGKANVFSSIVLLEEGFNSISVFGNPQVSCSTYLSDVNVIYNNEIVDCESIYKNGLEIYISECLTSNDITKKYKKDVLYLIEGKYYTDQFVSINNIYKNDVLIDYLIEYLYLYLSENNQNNIFVYSKTLFNLFGRFEKKHNSFNVIYYDSRLTYSAALTSLRDGEKIIIFNEVVCEGKGLSSLFDLTEDLNKISVFSFVDARKDDHSYITIHRDSGPQKVDIEYFSKMKINFYRDVDYETKLKVYIVDPVTFIPTEYDNPKRIFIEPSQLIDIAIECKALNLGHNIYMGKHYSILFNFNKLFNGLSCSVNSWLNDTYEIASNNYDKINVIYVDEKGGWESIIEKFFSDLKNVNCLSISKEILNSPTSSDLASEETIKQKECLWIIVPVLASGETFVDCLKLIEKYNNVRRVFISVLLSRVYRKRLEFYQKITQYSDIGIEVNALSSIPIPTYRDVSCPKCLVHKKLREITIKTSDLYSLNIVAERNRQLWDCVTIDDNNFSEIEETLATNDDKLELKLKILLHQALRSYQLRRDVSRFVLENNCIIKLYEVIGEEYTSERYQVEAINRILYRKNLYEEIISQTIVKGETYISFKALLGVFHISKDLILNNIRLFIINSIANNKYENVENSILLALMFPEDFSVIVRSTFHSIVNVPPTLQKLFEEVDLYSHWTGYNNKTKSIESFKRLLWFLRRSTPWGSKIEILRADLYSYEVGKSEFLSSFNSFVSHGVNFLRREIECIQSGSAGVAKGIWDYISDHQIIVDYIDNIDSYCNDINDTINGDYENNKLYISNIIDKIDKIGKYIVLIFENLFINVIRLKKVIKDFCEIEDIYSIIDVDVEVDEDFPGILFGFEELRLCLYEIIVNAKNEILNCHNPPKNPAIRFCFVFDNRIARLEIRDNIEWSSPLEPSGGLKQMFDVCNSFAATTNFEGHDDVRFQVVFQIDSTRRIANV